MRDATRIPLPKAPVSSAVSLVWLAACAALGAGGCIFLVDSSGSGGGGEGGSGTAASVGGAGGTGGAGTTTTGQGGDGAGGAGGGGGGVVVAGPLTITRLGNPNPTATPVDLAATSSRVAVSYTQGGEAKVYAAALPGFGEAAWLAAALPTTEAIGPTARLAFDVSDELGTRLYAITATSFFRAEDPLEPGSFEAPVAYEPRMSLPAPMRLIWLAEGTLAAIYEGGGLDTFGAIGAIGEFTVAGVSRGEALYTDIAPLHLGGTEFLAAVSDPMALDRCYPNNGCVAGSTLVGPARSVSAREPAAPTASSTRLVAYVEGGATLRVETCDYVGTPASCQTVALEQLGPLVPKAVALSTETLLASWRSTANSTDTSGVQVCLQTTSTSISDCSDYPVDLPAFEQIVPVDARRFVARAEGGGIYAVEVAPP